MIVKTVGLDLTKDVFQAHGISENGRVIFNKAIKRAKLLSSIDMTMMRLYGPAGGGCQKP